MGKANGEDKIRKGVRNGLLLVLSIISLWAILSYIMLEKLSPFDAIYETVCSLTLGKCDLSYQFPTKVASLFLALSSWLVFAVLVGYITEYVMGFQMGERKMKKQIGEMKNHIIVCGYGDLGKAACEIFRHAKQDYVVVDISDKAIGNLKDAGLPHVQGDALQNETLLKAGIHRAKMVLAALNNDSGNVFLCLTAKELNKKVRIASRAFSEQSVAKLHGAGADVIVMPEILGGMELAKQALDFKDNKMHEAFK